MKQKKNGIKTENDHEKSGKRYGEWLSSNRRHQAITLDQLSEGLCTTSMLGAIENGKKNPGWLLRERLFLRAGISSDSYESHLGCEEYAEWELQQKIVTALSQKDFARADALLVEYSEKYSMEGTEENGRTAKGKNAASPSWDTADKMDWNIGEQLRRQIYLGLKGVCLKRQGVAPEKLAELFREAVRLTVPAFEEKPLKKLVLSSPEIDLILEYAECLPPLPAIEKLREALACLQNISTEDDSRVLNYSKTTVLLCRALQKLEEKDVQNFTELIRLCDSAIMLLRETKRSYYLRELLLLKEASIRSLQELYAERREPKRAEALADMLAETKDFRQVFEDLYQRFGIPQDKWEDEYLYRTQDVYCIGDIVRIRRKMLKLTQAQLCEGICSQDTLRRLEGKKKTTQPAILWALCERLGLSPECEQTELVTANPEARLLEKKIRRLENSGCYEEALRQLEELKPLIDTENPINRQWLLYIEGMAEYSLGRLSREEYGNRLTESLECTLPLSILELPDEQECYLTNSEMACIYHLAMWDEEEDLEKAYGRMRLVFRVEGEFEEQGSVSNHIRTCELYTEYKAMLLYRFEKYDLSLSYIKRTFNLCLNLGRMNMLDSLLYDWMCNARKYAKKKIQEFENYNWKRDLKNCILLSHFCRNSVLENFYNTYYKNINEYDSN